MSEEENEASHSKKKIVGMGMRAVSRRGGSLSITIPINITKLLNLEIDDVVVFILDPKKEQIIFDKLTSRLTSDSGLVFSTSKKDVEQILKSERVK